MKEGIGLTQRPKRIYKRAGGSLYFPSKLRTMKVSWKHDKFPRNYEN